jgi:hypothetical protein
VCLLNYELERVWKGRTWPDSKSCPDIYLEELRKSEKNLVMIVFVPAKIRNVHLGHRNEKCYDVKQVARRELLWYVVYSPLSFYIVI